MKKASKKAPTRTRRTVRKHNWIDLMRVVFAVQGFMLVSLGSILIVVRSQTSDGGLLLVGFALIILAFGFKYIKIKTPLLEVEAKKDSA